MLSLSNRFPTLPSRLRRTRRTPLGPHLSLVDDLGGAPRVTELSDGAWLVRQRTPAGRSIVVKDVDEDTWLLRRRGGGGRVLRPFRPDHLRAGLLVDPRVEREDPLAHQHLVLRHLGVEHAGAVLRELGINIVLDVGANRGQYALELRAAGYTGRIVSFEPVPATADKLEANAAADPDWRVHRCALGVTDTVMDINVARAQGRLSSLLPASEFGMQWNRKMDVTDVVAVPVKRLDGLFDEVVAGVADPRVYLKLDTQGFDLHAFAGAGERVREVMAMQSEVSMVPLYEGMPHFTEQLSTYERAGFELTGMFPVVRDGGTLRVIEFDAMMVRAAAMEG